MRCCVSQISQGRALTSYRSFGLMLSVLNLPPNAAQKGAAINTLVIAPHRELANQLLHWIRRMYAGASHTGDVSPLSANGTITNFPGVLGPPLWGGRGSASRRQRCIADASQSWCTAVTSAHVGLRAIQVRRRSTIYIHAAPI